MTYFLAKTDPDTYSIGSLQKERKTTWDGVRNAQALQAIRAMKTGDRVFIYHSGGESRVVGLAKVASLSQSEPVFEFLRLLDPPVTLTEIKQSGLFNDWLLVRNSRLSTMSAPEAFVAWMRGKFPKAGI